MKKFLAGLLAFCLIIGAAEAGTTIWGSTDRGPAVGTMRFPVDTGSSSGPGYLSVSEVNTYVGGNFPSLSTLNSPLINTAQYPSTMVYTGPLFTYNKNIATQNYVDSGITDVLYPPTITFTPRLVSTSNIAGTYLNGTAGVGATLTVTATGTLTVDGVATALNDELLLINETAPEQNGLYKETTAGGTGIHPVLTRDTSYDTPAEMNGNIDVTFQNLYFQATAGTHASTLYYLVSYISTIGIDPLTYNGANDLNGFVARDSGFSHVHGPGTFYVADANSVLQAVTMSGDATLGNTGVLTLAGVGVPKGGTGAVTLAAHAVIIGNGTSLVQTAAPSTAGGVLTSNGASSDPTFQPSPAKIGITINGGGSVPATGAQPGIMITEAQTITNWYIGADQSCSAVIDVKRSGTSIIGSGNKPTLSSATTANAAANGSWTSKALSVGDLITFNLDSVATCNWITLSVVTTRP